MSWGGRRKGAGRKRIEFSIWEELAIAAEVKRRRDALALSKCETARERSFDRASPSYRSMVEAQRDMRTLRDGGKLKSAGFKQRHGDARSERKTFLKALKAKGLPSSRPTRPKGSLQALASEVARDMTQLMGKPVSKTRVLDAWKAHSRVFTENSDDET
jgi:hypothetical protein